MSIIWPRNIRSKILKQLNDNNLPFDGFRFSDIEDEGNVLGEGGFACVYEAIDTNNKGEKQKGYAIKINGFGDKKVNLSVFFNQANTQKELSTYDSKVVNVTDYIELLVGLDADYNVLIVRPIYSDKKEDIELIIEEELKDKIHREENVSLDSVLYLQFLLMEKLVPIIVNNNLQLPFDSNQYDEKEVLRLAYDIGDGIAEAHKRRLIHSDIKPDNIFYDSSRLCYKLGDFGVASKTEEGMAIIRGRSELYAAPELLNNDDVEYDYTIDIYSFGMVIYQLMGGSLSGRVRCQESFVLNSPPNGSKELKELVMKLLSYNPDDRYQSMDDVLNELEKIIFGAEVVYKRIHKYTPLLLSTIMAVIGAVAWRVTFFEKVILDYNTLIYVFLFSCILKGYLNVKEKKQFLTNLIIFISGSVLIFTGGKNWWIFALAMLFALFSKRMVGIIAIEAIVAKVTESLIISKSIQVSNRAEYRWIAVLLISLSICLVFMSRLLEHRRKQIIDEYFINNKIESCYLFFYGVLVLFGLFYKIYTNIEKTILGHILGVRNIEWILSWQPIYVGIGGVIFWIIWIAREKYMISKEI